MPCYSHMSFLTCPPGFLWGSASAALFKEPQCMWPAAYLTFCTSFYYLYLSLSLFVYMYVYIDVCILISPAGIFHCPPWLVHVCPSTTTYHLICILYEGSCCQVCIGLFFILWVLLGKQTTSKILIPHSVQQCRRQWYKMKILFENLICFFEFTFILYSSLLSHPSARAAIHVHL